MTLRSSRRRRARAARLREQTTFDGACLVSASVREMAAEDVVAAIPAETLAEIRAVDPHPLFVAIDAAQEGESTGELIVNGRNVGPQRKLWSAAAIADWAAKAKAAAVKGVARLWHGASHDAKREIGRLVASFAKKVGDKMHAITVGWIHDPKAKADFAAGRMGTGSMEAELSLERRDDGWLVRAVRAVQGFVLSGGTAKPGFPGATVLASVQELAKDKKEDEDMSDEPLTLRDVQELIRENGWDPSKVFEKTVLLGDRVVADAMKAEVESKVELALKERDEQIAKLKPDAEAWRRHTINAMAVGLIEKSALLKDVTKGTAAFVRKALSGRLDLSSVPEAERQAKVDAEVKAQLDFIKETGIIVPEPEGETPLKRAAGSAGPQSGGEPRVVGVGGIGGIEGVTLIDGKDYTDPKVNPQIVQ